MGTGRLESVAIHTRYSVTETGIKSQGSKGTCHLGRQMELRRFALFAVCPVISIMSVVESDFFVTTSFRFQRRRIAVALFTVGYMARRFRRCLISDF